jgi:hypothetical protein
VLPPKYVRAKQLVEEGALGRAFLAKQSEEHSGPHMPWFWDVNRSGGGVLLDMGCHSIEYARWVFNKPRAKSVYAQLAPYVHGDKTQGEDHSLCIVEYNGGMVSLAENSWAKHGGVHDKCEIYGSAAFTRADLLRGGALLTYSETGYGYAVEKAATTRGYTFTMFKEIWNYWFLSPFAGCFDSSYVQQRYEDGTVGDPAAATQPHVEVVLDPSPRRLRTGSRRAKPNNRTSPVFCAHVGVRTTRTPPASTRRKSRRRPSRRRQVRARREENPTEENSTKKTHPKKTTFSRRPNHRTIGMTLRPFSAPPLFAPFSARHCCAQAAIASAIRLPAC